LQNDIRNRFELKKWGGGELKGTQLMNTQNDNILENHVVSLELSKRLHELGLNKKSIYYWVDGKLLTNFNNTYLDQFFTVKCISPYSDDNSYALNKTFVYPAYLASELLDEFPADYEIIRKQSEYIDGSKVIDFILYCEKDGVHTYFEQGKNLCNVIAITLIYLIENGLVKIQDL